MSLSGPYATVATLLSSPLPIATAAPPRAALEAEIERLIDILDAFDAATEDLEPDSDLELSGDEDEPSLGANEYHPGINELQDQTKWAGRDTRHREEDLEVECEDEGAQCEGEGADIDNGNIWSGEPSLGSLSANMDQTGWSGGGSQISNTTTPIASILAEVRAPATTTPSSAIGSATRAPASRHARHHVRLGGSLSGCRGFVPAASDGRASATLANSLRSASYASEQKGKPGGFGRRAGLVMFFSSEIAGLDARKPRQQHHQVMYLLQRSWSIDRLNFDTTNNRSRHSGL